MKIYRRLLSYAFKYKLSLLACIIFVMILVASKVGGILKVGDFFFSTFIGKNFENISVLTILLLLGIGFIWAFSHYLTFVFSNYLAVSVMHDIRRDLFEKLMELPLAYYKKNRTGEILSRVLNDIGVIEAFFMNIAVELMAQPMTVVVIVVLMFIINTRISIYFFSLGPVLVLILAGIGSIVQKLSTSVQKNISDITSNIQESIYGIEIIKGYAVESNIKKRFRASNDNHLLSLKKELKFRFLGTPSAEFIGVVGVLIILVVGAISIRNQIATTQEIISFIFLALVLSEPLSRSTEIFMILRKLFPAASRIFEIIDLTEQEDIFKPEFGEIKGDIEFKSLFFEYEKNLQTLKNINLKIKKGETVAIVGSSGAGKSSLISMIAMFYVPQKGKLLIDGKNAFDFNPLSIRRQLSLVTQESILFSGTILDNIKLSKPEATDNEVIEAAKLANAHNFISKLPDGYKTILGDRGVRLSGGEKQRIALARAILRKPRILILDEATSSLDAESEQLIQNAMKNILGKQTTIIVSHKLSTIMDADKIVVMEGGHIAAIGTHKDLLHKGGIYKRLFNSQVMV